MTRTATLQAWAFPRDSDLAAMFEIVRSGVLPPDFRLRVLSSRGDAITVQLADRVGPVESDVLVCVQDHGAFELLRQESWPGGRVLLVLGAWPRK